VNRPTAVALAVSLALLSSACPTKTSSLKTIAAKKTAQATSPFSTNIVAWRLVIVHLSDTEAGLIPPDMRPDIGGVARAQAIIRALANRGGPDSIVVGVGDLFIPSPELSLELDGRSAVLTGNDKLGLMASALGNHELDLGEQFLADAIANNTFPYLSSTLTVKGGPLANVAYDIDAKNEGKTPWAKDIKGKLTTRAKVCTAEIDATTNQCKGLTVGLVGATTEELRLISAGASASLAMPNDLAGVRAAVQREVDAMEHEGINVIVLLSHLQGVAREKELVEGGLRGVDVVLAGGGENKLASKKHRLLDGDKQDRLCATWGEPCYPTTLTATDGKPVLLAATAGDFAYVGNLITSYDEAGVLTNYHEQHSRPWPVDEESLLELRASIDKDLLAFQQRAKKELVPLLMEVAQTDVFLEGTREEVRNRETNLGDLSADAIAFAARPHGALFAMRNGGGIRGSIGQFDEEGRKTGAPIRVMDLKTVLRFDSKIVVVETTHQQLKDTLESALRGAGTSKGQFPQVSKEVKLEYTTSAPEQTHTLKEGRIDALACPGARVRNLVVTPDGSGPIVVVKDGVVLTPTAKISWATLEYLTNGGDGWFPAQKVAAKPVEGMTEQSSLRAFIDDEVHKARWSSARRYIDGEGKRITTVTAAAKVDAPPSCTP
jgi:2',3'-cyclic-nucleotide 2'-phosphodiesterase (5'-nucleotidase family)